MIDNIQQENPKLKKTTLIYVQFVFLLMVIVLSVSVFLYLISVQTLKMFPMYFPTTLQDKSNDFIPELRAIPRKEAYVLGLWRKDISSLTLFLNELILGPRSIYLKNPISKNLYVYQIMEGRIRSNKVMFVIFSNQIPIQNSTQNGNISINEKKQFIFENDVKSITNWIQYNVNKYFNDYTVKIIFKSG